MRRDPRPQANICPLISWLASKRPKKMARRGLFGVALEHIRTLLQEGMTKDRPPIRAGSPAIILRPLHSPQLASTQAHR
jgi:hypothetical protein